MITLTSKAAKRMKDYLSNRGSGIGIRLLVKTYGCSGLGYHIEFADSINEDDNIFKQKDIQIIVDKKSLIYIDGTKVDYQTEGLNEGFRFNNPNAEAECGCGESFTIKK
jgi:iron-sulfur cluster assembly protein